MDRRVSIFLVVLMLFLAVYLYATNKLVIYNHSGAVIKKITVEAEYRHKELVNIDADEVLRFTFFAPFNKRVKIKVEMPDQIRTVTFSLSGFFIGEQYNQVEITPDGTIQYGALGLE